VSGVDSHIPGQAETLSLWIDVADPTYPDIQIGKRFFFNKVQEYLAGISASDDG
jgi:hypothetical protein